MKNSILSLLSILALSGLSYAGSDIAPAEEPVIDIPMVDNSALYIGLGFGTSYVNDNGTGEEISSDTVMLQAGYQYNENLAIEGRYSFGLNTDYDSGSISALNSGYDGDFSSWGVYIKPMYPIKDFSIYALLGYGGVMLDDLVNGDAYESGFQWGVGAGYAFTDRISVFVDYVSLYDDTGFDYRAQLDDVESDTWSVGFSYKF